MATAHRRDGATDRSFPALALFLAAGISWLWAASAPARAATDPILLIHDDSLTSYQAAPSGAQGVRPRPQQRAAAIDGSMAAALAHRIAAAGNPWGDAWNGRRSFNGLDLATGAYSQVTVDLAVPAQAPVVFARDFGARQLGGDSDGFAGRNWFAMWQPELVFVDADQDPQTLGAQDMLYMVLGAGRHLEFRRAAEDSGVFRGVNGTAGLIEFAEGDPGEPDTFTYYDPRGNTMVFFGFDGDSEDAAGQFWKFQDPAGNAAYVGDPASPLAALGGYDGGGRITTMYDSSDNRFTISYQTVDSVTRLDTIVAESKTGGAWGGSPTGVREIAVVSYFYYSTGDDADGDSGNLKHVRVRRALTDSDPQLDLGDHEERHTLYTYYKGGFNADTNPGHPNLVRHVMEPEGLRRLGSLAGSGAHAAAAFEYDSDRRVRKATFNGQCGSCGGTSGEFVFSYEGNLDYEDDPGYDVVGTPGLGRWATRTIKADPTGSWGVHYFDEAGQPLSIVVTDGDPAGDDPPPGFWATHVLRNEAGQIVEIRSPANSNGYGHATAAITSSSGAGLITVYDRVDGGDGVYAGALVGLPKSVRHKEGTGGTAYYQSHRVYALSNQGSYIQKSIGGESLVRPTVVESHTFESLTTTVSGGQVHQMTETPVSGELHLEKSSVIAPAVSTSKNGENAAATTSTAYRADGTVSFTKSPSGIITYTEFTKGRLSKRIEDADTTLTGSGQDFESVTIPTGFASSGSPQHRKTSFAHDDLGRVRATTLSTGRVTEVYYTKLGDGRLVTLSFPRVAGGTRYGPVAMGVANLAGHGEVQGVIALSAGGDSSALTAYIDETETDFIGAILVGTLERLSETIYDNTGTQRTASRVYHNIPTSASSGSASTWFDQTTYGYNGLGQLRRTKSPAGDITRLVYDGVNRLEATYRGTNDNDSSLFNDPDRDTSGTSDMTLVEVLEYDNGATGGNSLLTRRVQDADGLWVNDNSPGNPDDRRITQYMHDYRGRVIVAKPPVAPFTVSQYDNNGRVTAAAGYSSPSGLTASSVPTSTTNRLSYSTMEHDERGQPWRTRQYQVNQSTGAIVQVSSVDQFLETLSWRDSEGRLVKEHGQSIGKFSYDRLGRRTHRFLCASVNDSGYAHALDVDGDVVLEEHQSVHDADGRVVMTAAISRLHNDYGSGSTTGPLDTNADGDRFAYTGGNIKGRIQITAMWYDEQDRLLASAFYGTNHATANAGTFDRNGSGMGSPPSPSGTVLVTAYVYNGAGQAEDVVDPRGLVTRTLYDRAGRRTAVVENAGGSPERWTRFDYLDGLMIAQWADLDGDGSVDADDQVTQYVYGVVKGTDPGESRIGSGSLLGQVIYPEQYSPQPTADRSVFYAYNALAERILAQDQTGTVVETDYDAGGREIHRRVTNLGTGLDGAVRRVTLAYTPRGQVQTLTQWSHEDPGSGSVVDQVAYEYTHFGHVAAFLQDHDSVVGAGGVKDYFTVAYGYELAGGSGTPRLVRRMEQEILIGTTVKQTLSYKYNSASGGQDLPDLDLGRVTKVAIGTSSPVTLAEYRYLGAGRVVETAHAEPAVYNRVHDGASTPAYPGLDRFNRVAASTWTKDLSTDRHFYRVELAYDENSNITRAVDHIHRNTSGDHLFDAAYTIDGLNRVTGVREGHWDGSAITTGNRKREELWGLDMLGNWGTYQLDLDGNGSIGGLPELDEVRTHNPVNEILTRDVDNDTTPDHTLTHNPRGDLTDDGESFQYVYDAFGRLRRVKSISTGKVVAEYWYNALGHRIAERHDSNDDGEADADDPTYHAIHDARWRRVGTVRSEGGVMDDEPKELWAYHAAGLAGEGGSSYIDAVIMRDRDTAADWEEEAGGTLGQRVYPLQNWRADVSVVVNHDGSRVLEWVKYSAYGVPILLAAYDADCNGVRNSTDLSVFSTLWTAGGSTYDVRADYNLDGVVNSTDLSAHTSDWSAGGSAIGRGFLSRSDSATTVFNRTGYAGYRWDPVTGNYHARNRDLNPVAGRWGRRDPEGYVDGMSLYEYVGSRPISERDPFGLAITAEECRSEVAQLWLNDPEIKNLVETLRNGNCDFGYPSCRECHGGGEFNFGTGGITLCYGPGGLINLQRLREAMLHELYHAYTHCGGDSATTCEDAICDELRAYQFEGGCREGGALRRDGESEAACLERWVLWSARNRCGGRDELELRRLIGSMRDRCTPRPVKPIKRRNPLIPDSGFPEYWTGPCLGLPNRPCRPIDPGVGKGDLSPTGPMPPPGLGPIGPPVVVPM